MKKKIKIGLITLIVVAATAVGGWRYFQAINWPKLGIDPKSIPTVVTEKDLSKFSLGSTEKLWGFCNKDLSQKDLSQLSSEYISKFTFDEDTKWPTKEKMSQNFDPKCFISKGKDPGLSLNEIHKKGITGKGISVAVIDKPILSTHNEFKDRIKYVKIGEDKNLHFHGIACASILAGESCGVAPEAKLYYFAIDDRGLDFSYYSNAMEELIKLNKGLPKEDKIKIVSVSSGFKEESGEKWTKWNECVKKAKEEGITVVYSNSLGKKNFIWGGCSVLKDRNLTSNYEVTAYAKGKKANDKKIIVPADFRTTASNDSDDKYVYWGDGGFSWAIPYVTGLAALAWQINPNITFDDIEDKLIETKAATQEGYSVIDVKKFIEVLEAHK